MSTFKSKKISRTQSRVPITYELTVSLPADLDTIYTYTITHNLGYIPAVNILYAPRAVRNISITKLSVTEVEIKTSDYAGTGFVTGYESRIDIKVILF